MSPEEDSSRYNALSLYDHIWPRPYIKNPCPGGHEI